MEAGLSKLMNADGESVVVETGSGVAFRRKSSFILCEFNLELELGRPEGI